MSLVSNGRIPDDPGGQIDGSSPIVRTVGATWFPASLWSVVDAKRRSLRLRLLKKEKVSTKFVLLFYTKYFKA